MTGPRHSWSEPVRTENLSERVCVNCGLRKLHRQESGSHWVEFWRAEKLPTFRTPACPGEVPAEQARGPYEAVPTTLG